MPDFLHSITQRGTPVLLSSALSNAAAPALAAAGSAGVSTSVARADHTHPYPTAAQVGAQPTDATLTALASMAWSAGTQVPTLTAADTITLKTVGSAAGNLLDKAAGDALYQPLDGDLTSIAGLPGTTGLLKKTGAGAWTLDTDTYLTRTIAFNNLGQAHNTYTSFAAITDFGPAHVQQAADGPTATSNHQFYTLSLGLGSEYPFSQYAHQLLIPRVATGVGNNPYMWFRQRESGAWGAWSKMYAGYADSAGAVAWSAVSGKPSTISGYGITDAPTKTGTGASGTWPINISGTSANSAACQNLGSGYYTADTWLRAVADNSQFKIYGNSRTLYFRSDGVTNPNATGNYPFMFNYGGDASANRVMIINTDGQIWSSYYGWLNGMSTSGSAGSVPWSGVTGKPSTLGGYGISDAVSTGGYTNINGVMGIRHAQWTQCALSIGGVGTGSGTYGIICYDSNNNNTFWVRDDGYCKAQNYFYVAGTGYASDARLKTDITPLHGALGLALAIPSRTWRWRKDALGRPQYGPIAQEVEAIAPELVEEAPPDPGQMLPDGERGQLYLNTGSFIGVLLGAVQELAHYAFGLEARIACLEGGSS